MSIAQPMRQLLTVLAVVLGTSTLWAQEQVRQAGADRAGGGVRMKIVVTSVMVDNQEKALKFYTEVLGFVKKTDVPAGPARWLTVVSPEQPDGPELLLEPIGFPPARTYQKALFDAGIPLTSFAVTDLAAVHERLEQLGVVFRTPPKKVGPATVAVFEDTCGNLIQLAQK